MSEQRRRKRQARTIEVVFDPGWLVLLFWAMVVIAIAGCATADAKPQAAGRRPTPAGALPETPLHCAYKPPAGLTFDDGRIVEIVDGDTITVERTIRLRIRLNGCWAPESRTTDQAEKRLGLASKSNLTALALGKRCTVSIPTAGVAHLGEVTTLGRFVADVWIEGDDQTLSARQVEARQASSTKAGALGR